MDCSLPGYPVHGIFQALVLEWIAIFSKSSLMLSSAQGIRFLMLEQCSFPLLGLLSPLSHCLLKFGPHLQLDWHLSLDSALGSDHTTYSYELIWVSVIISGSMYQTLCLQQDKWPSALLLWLESEPFPHLTPLGIFLWVVLMIGKPDLWLLKSHPQSASYCNVEGDIPVLRKKRCCIDFLDFKWQR